MFRNYLESITGIGIYPLISFTIFFLFFIGVAWYVIRANKDFIREMKNFPLKNDNYPSND
jgi:cbb3-type cytochrome oxidase subunit 3